MSRAMSTQVVGRGVILVDLDRTGFDRGVVGLQRSSKSKFAAMGALAAKGLAAAGVGLGLFAAKATKTGAEFDKTMNLVAAATNAPQRQVKALSDLALKMGADTVFSANEAGRAMLELAKGGMTTAQIRGGALAAVMDLAAAGELNMAEAANITVRAMGAFNINAKRSAAVADALAGAANASSADVGELSQALSQVGASANTVGFSLQETTAILGLFADNGLRGSDAGTSLKTMLIRLQPETKRQVEAFRALNLLTEDGRSKFVKANGEFRSASEIFRIMRVSTKNLTDAEKQRLIVQAFGTDAQRAALIAARKGEAGLRKYLRATRDTEAAERMSRAAMKGTAGALEQLSGSWETLQLRLYQVIKPFVLKGLRGLTGLLNLVGSGLAKLGDSANKSSGPVRQLRKTWTALGDFFVSMKPALADVGRAFNRFVAPAVRDVGRAVTNDFLPAFREALPVIKPVARFLIRVLGGVVVAAVVSALKLMELRLKAMAVVLRTIGRVWARWGDDITRITRGAMAVIRRLFGNAADFIRGVWRALTSLLRGDWQGFWRGVRQATRAGWDTVRTIFRAGTRVALTLVRVALRAMWTAIRTMWTKVIPTLLRGAFRLVRGIFSTGFRVVTTLTRGALRTARNLIRAAWNADIPAMLRRAWAAIRDRFRDGWRFLTTLTRTATRAIVDRFRSVFNRTLPDLLRNAVRALGRVWDNIQGIMRRPVDWVKRNVIDRLIGFVRNALDFLGIGGGGGGSRRRDTRGATQGRRSSRGGGRFARGGVLPGYTPGRDVHKFVSDDGQVLHLSGGEAIMRPEFTRSIGRRGVERLNSLARRGKLHKLHAKPLHFFLGGVMPTRAARISRHSNYGWARWAGDINGPGNDLGQPIRAWKSGTVASVVNLGNSSYGLHIRLNHKGQQSLYAHLSRALVRAGQRVRAGQVIGRLGDSGRSTGPHLHFEVKSGTALPGGTSGGGALLGVLNALRKAALNRLGNGLEAIRGRLGNVPGGEFGRKIALGTFRKLASAAREFVGDKASSLVSGLVGRAARGIAGVRRWAPVVKTVLRMLGQPQNLLGVVLQRMQRESSGNPRAINNWDSNARRGDPSRGLMQTIGATFRAFAGKFRNRGIYDPLANIYAALRYSLSRYGSIRRAMTQPGGYDSGGLAFGVGMMPKRTPRPERVLSPRQTLAFERWMQHGPQLEPADEPEWEADALVSAMAGAAGGGGARLPNRVDLIVDGQRFRAYVRGIADDAVDDAMDYEDTRGRTW